MFRLFCFLDADVVVTAVADAAFASSFGTSPNPSTKANKNAITLFLILFFFMQHPPNSFSSYYDVGVKMYFAPNL